MSAATLLLMAACQQQRRGVAPADIEINNIYGLLYNWWVVDTGLLGNSDFYNPTPTIWTTMLNYVNSTYNISPNDFGVGGHLKNCRQVDSPLGGDCATSVHPRWNVQSTFYGRNTLHFSVHGGGRRNTTGFSAVGIEGNYQNYESIGRIIRFQNSLADYYDYSFEPKTRGISIRLTRPATALEISTYAEGVIIPNYYKGNNDFLYDCVRISTNIWLAENLCETKYNDGTTIPFAGANGVNFTNAEWGALTTPGLCAYNNDVTTWAYTIP